MKIRILEQDVDVNQRIAQQLISQGIALPRSIYLQRQEQIDWEHTANGLELETTVEDDTLEIKPELSKLEQECAIRKTVREERVAKREATQEAKLQAKKLAAEEAKELKDAQKPLKQGQY